MWRAARKACSEGARHEAAPLISLAFWPCRAMLSLNDNAGLFLIRRMQLRVLDKVGRFLRSVGKAQACKFERNMWQPSTRSVCSGCGMTLQTTKWGMVVEEHAQAREHHQRLRRGS